MTQTDVLIIGAGMAGLTLACALAESDLNILLIDPHVPPSPPQWPATFDPRVSALTHASENILRKLGVWDAMSVHRVAAFTGMDVWDANGTGNIQFGAEESGVTHLGHLVENRVTTHCLFERLQKNTTVEFRPLTLARILENENGGDAAWKVLLSDGSEIVATLLIGADGAQSKVRDQLGFRCRTWAYGQSAIVTTVTTEQPHDNIARQIFRDTGPLAFLPLREHTGSRKSCISSIVWSLTSADAQQVMMLDDATFCQRLGAAFEQRLGKVIATDRRFCFPLTQNHAVDYVLPGVALIGDAAHTLHPLAGQGINLGFLDAAVLAEEILHAHEKGLPIGDVSVLRRYQRRRKADNLLMMSVMEGFKRLFGTSIPPLQVARNLGMSFVNRHTLIKQQILQRAMGLAGDLPALAQPGLIADF